MSPSSLRVLAGAAAVLFALLTAIAVGFVSRPVQCPPPTSAGVPSTAPTPTPVTSSATTSVIGPGSVGGSVARQSPNPPPTPPAAPASPVTGAVQAAPAAACTKGPFAAVPAMLALVGAGLAASVAIALLLLAGARRG